MKFNPRPKSGPVKKKEPKPLKRTPIKKSIPELKKIMEVAAKKHRTKDKSLPDLIRELDTVFSLFIRQRDSNTDGYGKCVTCMTYDHYTEMDCGHYASRKHGSTRHDEQDCAMQCKTCNRMKDGEEEKFAMAIDRRYGQGTSAALKRKAKQTLKLSRAEVKEKIEHYKSLVI